MNLVVPFENYTQWQIFFTSSSNCLIEFINDSKLQKSYFLFPNETVEFDKLDKKAIREVDLYVKNFFYNKQGKELKIRKTDLIINEIKKPKYRLKKILYLLPTFFFKKDSLKKLVNKAKGNSTLFVYPMKFAFIAEINELLKKDGIPFYYYQKNEFNQDKIAKREEFIFLTNSYLYIRSSDFHPLVFKGESVKENFHTLLSSKNKKNNKIFHKELKRLRIYKLINLKKETFLEKIKKQIKHKKYVDFFSSKKYLKSCLYQIIKKEKL